MYPTRKIAEKLLIEAEKSNPGPWVAHSKITAHCAEKIASECNGLNIEKAYVLGLLHDIGRKFGVRHLGHVVDGYRFMMLKKYDEVARVCLSHSFNNKSISDYVGDFDLSQEEFLLVTSALDEMVYDDYDRLIQLCDALAGADKVLDVEERMIDVKNRYGEYPQEKWNKNIQLLQYFKDKTGRDVYSIVR